MTEFKEQLDTLFNMDDEDWSSVAEALMYDEFDKSLFESHSIQTKLIQSHGGEGEGDDFYTVYSLTKDDETVYAKFQGWYASYNGAEFTEWFFVSPEDRTITVYC